MTKVILRLLTAMAIFSFSSDLNAQEEAPSLSQEIMDAYDYESIIIAGNKYEINGRRYPFGVFRHRLRRELRRSEMAIDSYRKYRRKTLTAFALGLGLPVGYVASILTINPAPLMVGTILYVGMIPVLFAAERDFQRAAWFYNRDVLKEAIQEHEDEMNIED